jgi:hypothetical protein
MLPGNIGPNERRAREEEVQEVSHSDLIERIRTIQDALPSSSLANTTKRVIFKELNDIAWHIFCEEIAD